MQGGISGSLNSAMLSKCKFIFSYSEEILWPKEGIIFGLFSNSVLYCGSKTVSYVGFEGFDFNFSWLIGCFGFNGPLRQSFSLYRAVSQREGERGERIDESKNVQTTPTRTYCKRNRPLPYCYQNCRTPQHWKFTQHHRTTRPPPLISEHTA